MIENEMKSNKGLREIAEEIRSERIQCNCDLDNWEPQRSTGHSSVCRIHKIALLRFKKIADEVHGC